MSKKYNKCMERNLDLIREELLEALKNKNYLKELQLFLDQVDGIKDEELKHRVTNQMLICDETLTKIAENEIDKAYKKGYNEAKKV